MSPHCTRAPDAHEVKKLYHICNSRATPRELASQVASRITDVDEGERDDADAKADDDIVELECASIDDVDRIEVAEDRSVVEPAVTIELGDERERVARKDEACQEFPCPTG